MKSELELTLDVYELKKALGEELEKFGLKIMQMGYEIQDEAENERESGTRV